MESIKIKYQPIDWKNAICKICNTNDRRMKYTTHIILGKRSWICNSCKKNVEYLKPIEELYEYWS